MLPLSHPVSVGALFAITALVSGCSVGSRPSADQLAQSQVESQIVRQRIREATAAPVGSREQPVEHAAKPIQAQVQVHGPKVIAPGYKIRLTTLEDEQLNGEFVVDFEGELELPYGVKAAVGGKPESSLTSVIISAYRAFFRVPPTISTEILERSYLIEVQGLVQEPGQYTFRERSSLDELMAKAGGLRLVGSEPVAKFVRIQRGDEVQMLKLDEYYSGALADLPRWTGGEQVFFQSEGPEQGSAERRDYVHVLGEIESPGEYAMRDDAGFFFYLARAGGPTAQADLRKVEVIRINGSNKESTVVDLVETKSLPTLAPGDIVMVHSKEDNQVITNVSSVISSVATILLAAVAL